MPAPLSTVRTYAECECHVEAGPAQEVAQGHAPGKAGPANGMEPKPAFDGVDDLVRLLIG